MTRVFSFLLIIIMLSSCKKEDGSLHNGYFWIYGSGLIDMYGQEATNAISEKWKIKQVHVGGCVIDNETEKKIRVANKKTLAAIAKKYGKGWEAQYDKDIEDYAVKRDNVTDVLLVNKRFQNKLSNYNVSFDDVNNEITVLNDPEQYEVTVVNPRLKYENKICFRVKVNTQNRTVNLIK
ncbi:FEKKY domain-containing protein [Chryseobacterium sp. MYb328]|uniref:FEKKY domain-containing protein n=1 Tax=Chryseobacterium sp. MYb328 TaxID=2745231 RepID=UPI0030B00E7B